MAISLLLFAASAIVIVSIPAATLGWKWEGRKEFLKSYRTPDWAEAHIKNQMDYVLLHSDSNTVIFVGDSTTTVGIQPVLFEALTGVRSYNLGLPGFVGIDTNLRSIELYLMNRPAPQLLIYSAHPKDYGLDAPTWGDIRPRFAWSYGTWSGTQPAEPGFSILYYLKEGLRIAAGELRGGRSHYFPKSVHDWKELVLKQRGFFASPGVLPADEKFKPAEIGSFEVSAWRAKHLHALAQLTARHGIRLLILPAPVMTRARQEDGGPLLAWLNEFVHQYPHVKLGDNSLWIYDVADFSGAVHMNAAGATRFTEQLAKHVMTLYPDLRNEITAGAGQ